MNPMRLIILVAAVLAGSMLPGAQAPLDREAERWVETTMKKLSSDQMVGQLLMPRFAGVYTSSDSDVYDRLSSLVQQAHVGGVIGFGGEEQVPQVLLNPTYGPIILGQPLALASMLNRLQAIASIPLLTAADFEWGVGMRIEGATRFPRAMAFGAAGDEQLAFEAGRITAVEGRALGVHVNFAPVVDVNNNPRNPVINIRSFGEDVGRVGALASAWVRGIQQGGMLATIKHFPGHGDTAVDSHLGLPVIPHPRERLDQVELAPFRAGIAAGAAGVMVAHIELLGARQDTGAGDVQPAGGHRSAARGPRLRRPDLLGRDEHGRRGQDGHGRRECRQSRARRHRRRPRFAGHDGCLSRGEGGGRFRPDLACPPRGVGAPHPHRQGRLGLHRTRAVNIESAPLAVGTRRHAALARQVSERAVTLIKDERDSVPMKVPASSSVLFLSVLDYPRGWRIAAPSRVMLPALRARWPDLQAVEISDATTPNELALIRAMASRFDAIVAGVFVRVSSGTNRLDLAAPVVDLLQDLARSSATPQSAVRDSVLRQSLCADDRARITGNAADL